MLHKSGLKTFFVVLCCLGVFQGVAGNFVIRNYTPNDGLPSATVMCGMQDSRGYIWLGTDAGLTRFDGINFKHYYNKHGLTDNFVITVNEFDDGYLWVGTSQALHKFNGKSFTAYDEQDGLPAGYTTCMAYGPDSALYVGTAAGPAIFENDSAITPSFLDTLQGIPVYDMLHANSKFYFATYYGLFVLAQNKIHKIKETGEGKFTGLAQDRNGAVYATTAFEHAFVISPVGEVDTLGYFPRKEVFSSNSFELLKNGQMALCGEGKIHYFNEAHEIVDSTENTALNSNSFMIGFFEDFEGNIWTCSYNGLQQFKRSFVNAHPYELCNGKPFTEDLTSFYVYPDDGIRISTNAGNHYNFENGCLEQLPDEGRFASETSELYLKTEDGREFIGSGLSGIVVKKGGKKYFYSKGNQLPHNSFFTGTIASDGTAYIGGKRGILVRFNDVKPEVFQTDLTKQSSYTQIVEGSNGFMWLGSTEGLYGFKSGTFYNFNENLPGQKKVYITGLKFQPPNTLWVTTLGYGLFQYGVVRDSSLQLAKQYTVENGFPSDFVKAPFIDKKGNLWLGSNNGVIYVTRSDSEYVSHPLNANDGFLPSNWVSINFTEIGDSVMMASAAGLHFIDHDNIDISGLPPKIVLSEIKTRSGNLAPEQLTKTGFNNIPQQFELSADKNYLSFHFNGFHFRNPESVTYTYKMEGMDDKWSDPTQKQSVTFQNIPPGTYTFKVKSINSSGYESQAASVAFTIPPPFWQTWWFVCLAVFLVLSAFYSIYYLRVKGIVKRKNHEMKLHNEVLESRLMAFQARMNPHFIFNSLNSIQYFITANDKSSSLTYLSKFGRLLRQTLDNSKRSLVTVEEEIEMLKAYIEMESLRFDNKFDHEFDVENETALKHAEIPGMIVQPFVENAIHHGLMHKKDKGKLKVRFYGQEHNVICEVIDNGIGRNAAEKLKKNRKKFHKSYGMKIAKNRLDLLNREIEKIGSKAELVIEDLYGENGRPVGTKVVLNIPKL